jgi:hypothetical protein
VENFNGYDLDGNVVHNFKLAIQAQKVLGIMSLSQQITQKMAPTATNRATSRLAFGKCIPKLPGT